MAQSRFRVENSELVITLDSNMRKKTLHPNFINYQKMIVKHPNYKGMPDLYKKNGEIAWEAIAVEIREKRRKWWLNKKQKLLNNGIKLSKRAELQPTCLYIHPTKKKADHVTGIMWDIRYIYPRSNVLKKLIIFLKQIILYLTQHMVRKQQFLKL